MGGRLGRCAAAGEGGPHAGKHVFLSGRHKAAADTFSATLFTCLQTGTSRPGDGLLLVAALHDAAQGALQQGKGQARSQRGPLRSLELVLPPLACTGPVCTASSLGPASATASRCCPQNHMASHLGTLARQTLQQEKGQPRLLNNGPAAICAAGQQPLPLHMTPHSQSTTLGEPQQLPQQRLPKSARDGQQTAPNQTQKHTLAPLPLMVLLRPADGRGGCRVSPRCGAVSPCGAARPNTAPAALLRPATAASSSGCPCRGANY